MVILYPKYAVLQHCSRKRGNRGTKWGIEGILLPPPVLGVSLASVLLVKHNVLFVAFVLVPADTVVSVPQPFF